MASSLHEGIVLLFRNRPELVPELMRDALHVELPAYSELRIEAADLGTVLPAEFHADLVVLLVDGKPVFAVVVEVQLAPDAAKRFSWPVYEAGVRARFRCPSTVLVVTPIASVAAWARKPIELAPGGSVFRALVLGPEGVPIVTDDAAAAREPELAVLSALAHGAEEVAEQIAKAAVRATEGFDAERRTVYWDMILGAINPAARRALEAVVLSSGYEFQSEIARNSFNKGKGAARAEAILEFLDARGLVPNEEQRARILACTDLEQLRQWVRRAATVATVDELFA